MSVFQDEWGRWRWRREIKIEGLLVVMVEESRGYRWKRSAIRKERAAAKLEGML